MEKIQDINDEFSDLSTNEIEDIIIKSCFRKSDIGSKVFPELVEDLFSDSSNKTIVRAIQKYHKKHNIWPKVKELYDFELDGDAKDKFKQIGNISLTEYRDDYLREKIEDYVRRLKTFKVIQSAISDPQFQNMDNMDSMVESLRKAVNFNINSKLGVSIKKDVSTFLNYLTFKNKVVPSGLGALNCQIESGYPSKAITVYYGESNIGKTTILCSEAASAYVRGYNVLYISLEMPDFEIFKKIASNILTVTPAKIKDENPSKVADYLHNVSNADLKIVYYPAYELTALKLKALIEDLISKEKFKPDIVFLDYINCMSSNRASTAKHEILGYVTKELENVANELDFPIVTASQFNRSGYGNEKAGAVNVGESLDIFKYSSLGISLYRDELLTKKGYLLLKIIKNRYGPVDTTFLCKMDYEYMKLSDATPSEIQMIEQERKSMPQNPNVTMRNGVPIPRLSNKKDDED